MTREHLRGRLREIALDAERLQGDLQGPHQAAAMAALLQAEVAALDALARLDAEDPQG